jgi:hypothetical protein
MKIYLTAGGCHHWEAPVGHMLSVNKTDNYWLRLKVGLKKNQLSHWTPYCTTVQNNHIIQLPDLSFV